MRLYIKGYYTKEIPFDYLELAKRMWFDTKDGKRVDFSYFGNIFHKALEKYARRVEREGLEWTEVTKKQQEQFASESVDESIVDYSNTVIYSSANDCQDRYL